MCLIKNLFLLLLTLAYQECFSQTKISEKAISDIDPLLSNATVTLKGTGVNTTTNNNGVFSIMVTGTKIGYAFLPS